MRQTAEVIAPFSGTTDRTGKYRHDGALRELALRLIKRYPERLGNVVPDRIAFLINDDDKPAKGGRPTCARCIRLTAREEFLTQAPGQQGFEHAIEVFTENCIALTHNQQTLLLYHELLHIGEEGKLRIHDCEEFGEILAEFGPDPFRPERPDIPNILSGSFAWDKARKPQGLFAVQAGEAAGEAPEK